MEKELKSSHKIKTCQIIEMLFLKSFKGHDKIYF